MTPPVVASCATTDVVDDVRRAVDDVRRAVRRFTSELDSVEAVELDPLEDADGMVAAITAGVASVSTAATRRTGA